MLDVHAMQTAPRPVATPLATTSVETAKQAPCEAGFMNVRNADATYNDHVHHATKDDPQYEIKSDKASTSHCTKAARSGGSAIDRSAPRYEGIAAPKRPYVVRASPSEPGVAGAGLGTHFAIVRVGPDFDCPAARAPNARSRGKPLAERAGFEPVAPRATRSVS